MWAGVITIFPEMFRSFAAAGVSSRAIERGILELELFNPRDFTADRHATVDDRPYGGGPGMVMKPGPLQRTIDAARERSPGGAPRMLYLTPQGRRLDQDKVTALAEAGLEQGEDLLFLCGRYEGVDERLLQREVDEELSIGDYVLSGGELGAMVVLDAVARYLPGTLGNAESVRAESHVAGLLDCPQYTRPETFRGERVPEVLLSGDHERVRRWRLKMALGRTFERRPDLLTRRVLDGEARGLLSEYLAERRCRAARDEE